METGDEDLEEFGACPTINMQPIMLENVVLYFVSYPNQSC